MPPAVMQQGWREQVTMVRGDVRDQSLVERTLAEAQAQTLLHLAAQTQVGAANANPVSSFESNIRGTWSVLEAARRSPLVEQTVVASSDKAYGSHERGASHEELALLALHPYDVSKAAADMIAASYAHTFDMRVALSRCVNCFGPGDTNWARLVPGTIRALLQGERPILRSDGSHQRDFLFVADGARAYLQLVEGLATDRVTPGDAFNFSSERSLSVLEMVALIQKAVGTSLTPNITNTATNEVALQHLSAAKARDVLDWAPSITIEEGVALTIPWYRELLRR
jgi:CDP-glucose 4,6-dehydratase